MLDIIDQEHFDSVVEFAKSIGLYDNPEEKGSLKNSLDFLYNFGGKRDDGEDRCLVRITKDDTYSFYFVIYNRAYKGKPKSFVYNGGVIYHGAHDNYGDGSFPTLSVSLEPVNGWQVHT